MAKRMTPGTKAPVSGQYEIINTKGVRTGIERTVVKQEPLPPTPKQGYKYLLVDKTKH